MFNENTTTIVISTAAKVAIVAAGVIVANVGTVGVKAAASKVSSWFKKS